MAQLDLRERRLSAVLAYVGDRAVVHASFARLAARDGAGSLGEGPRALLAWRMAGREDDLSLSLVHAAAGGELDLAACDADVVVLVVGRARAELGDALARRAALAEELSRAGPLPVIVQFERDPSADAVPVPELVSLLALEGWAHAAPREDADVAVDAVELAADAVWRAIEDTSCAGAPDPTPLLTALRDVISASVDAAVGAVSARLGAELQDSAEAIAALSARVVKLDERAVSLGTRLTALEEAQRALTRGVSMHEASLGRTTEALRDGLAATKQLEAAIGALDERVASAAQLAARSATEAEESRAAVARAAARIDALERSTSRALDKVTASIGSLPAAITAADERHAARSLALERAVQAGAGPVEAVGARAADLAARLTQKDARDEERILRVEALVRAAAAHSDEKTASVAESLEALLDELKTKKKGWFG
ncbi:MAG: hypothetical protein IT374_20400 [Polyangiaceae bacterium]|nr:hypothetical protein [Polyangiaceae bacterium]